jgi:hemoglobin
MNRTGIDIPLRDIETEEDVKALVDAFYESVNKDELLSPIFNEVAQVNWAHHMPQMYNFWSSILLGTHSYSGRPFPKHMVLPLEQEHFAQWLRLFGATLDRLYAGPCVDLAKERAVNIASMFQYRMGLIDVK